MKRLNSRYFTALLLATNLVVALPFRAAANNDNQGGGNGTKTTTPIKYLVVIFQENESFDHYFGTYPSAANPPNETPFFARPNTPSVNGLNNALVVNNPNGPTTNAPFRLDPSQAYTCDQSHGYTPEQQAFDSGLMDKFPEFTAKACASSTYPSLAPYGTRIVMGYYDGNTVTALWNYAQFFAMSDNFHGSTFGPSAVGAVNLASGMTGNTDPAHTKDDAFGDLAFDVVNGTMIGDPDPWYEDCVSYDQTSFLGKNIGDLLNAKHVSWGWFQGGFTPSAVVNGVAQCSTTTNRLDGTPETAYAGYHNPFQFYATTNNQHHIPPQNVEEVGHNGPANHIYDLSFFQKAAIFGNLPSVSFLKQPAPRMDILRILHRLTSRHSSCRRSIFSRPCLNGMRWRLSSPGTIPMAGMITYLGQSSTSPPQLPMHSAGPGRVERGLTHSQAFKHAADMARDCRW